MTKTMTKTKRRGRPKKALTERAKAAAAQAANADEEQQDQSRLPGVICTPPTNHFSADEVRRLQHAGEIVHQMKQDNKRHRDEWLKVVGPELVMVRDRIFEVTGQAFMSPPDHGQSRGGGSVAGRASQF
jgi:hypothetical protein